MTDDKKHDDKDRKKVSDEELEDVAGGGKGTVKFSNKSKGKGKKLSDEELKDVAGGAGASGHNTTRSNRST
ncbi:MAG: hypothetical protein OSB09_11490 [Planctomycetota bacterium]|nr:hypothetical protein [Planctomycetota bacterium]